MELKKLHIKEKEGKKMCKLIMASIIIVLIFIVLYLTGLKKTWEAIKTIVENKTK